MPQIVLLYLNWLQSLIEARSFLRGLALMLLPVAVAALLFVWLSNWIGVVLLVASGLWAWPLQILHYLHWKNRNR